MDQMNKGIWNGRTEGYQVRTKTPNQIPNNRILSSRSDSPSISEDISNKRARPEFVDLTLVSENHDLTLVDSQSDYGSEPASQDLVNLHLSISPTNNVITIDDSDSETEYGTPPPPEALLLVP